MLTYINSINFCQFDQLLSKTHPIDLVDHLDLSVTNNEMVLNDVEDLLFCLKKTKRNNKEKVKEILKEAQALQKKLAEAERCRCLMEEEEKEEEEEENEDDLGEELLYEEMLSPYGHNWEYTDLFGDSNQREQQEKGFNMEEQRRGYISRCEGRKDEELQQILDQAESLEEVGLMEGREGVDDEEENAEEQGEEKIQRKEDLMPEEYFSLQKEIDTGTYMKPLQLSFSACKAERKDSVGSMDKEDRMLQNTQQEKWMKKVSEISGAIEAISLGQAIEKKKKKENKETIQKEEPQRKNEGKTQAQVQSHIQVIRDAEVYTNAGNAGIDSNAVIDNDAVIENDAKEIHKEESQRNNEVPHMQVTRDAEVCKNICNAGVHSNGVIENNETQKEVVYDVMRDAIVDVMESFSPNGMTKKSISKREKEGLRKETDVYHNGSDHFVQMDATQSTETFMENRLHSFTLPKRMERLDEEKKDKEEETIEDKNTKPLNRTTESALVCDREECKDNRTESIADLQQKNENNFSDDVREVCSTHNNIGCFAKENTDDRREHAETNIEDFVISFDGSMNKDQPNGCSFGLSLLDNHVTPQISVTSFSLVTPATATPATPATPSPTPTPSPPATPSTPSTSITPVTPVTPYPPSPPATPATPSTSVTPATLSTSVTPVTPVTAVTAVTAVTPVTTSPPSPPVTTSPPATPVTTYPATPDIHSSLLTSVNPVTDVTVSSAEESALCVQTNDTIIGKWNMHQNQEESVKYECIEDRMHYQSSIYPSNSDESSLFTHIVYNKDDKIEKYEIGEKDHKNDKVEKDEKNNKVEMDDNGEKDGKDRKNEKDKKDVAMSILNEEMLEHIAITPEAPPEFIENIIEESLCQPVFTGDLLADKNFVFPPNDQLNAAHRHDVTEDELSAVHNAFDCVVEGTTSVADPAENMHLCTNQMALSEHLELSFCDKKLEEIITHSNVGPEIDCAEYCPPSLSESSMTPNFLNQVDQPLITLDSPERKVEKDQSTSNQYVLELSSIPWMPPCELDAPVEDVHTVDTCIHLNEENGMPYAEENAIQQMKILKSNADHGLRETDALNNIERFESSMSNLLNVKEEEIGNLSSVTELPSIVDRALKDSTMIAEVIECSETIEKVGVENTENVETPQNPENLTNISSSRVILDDFTADEGIIFTTKATQTETNGTVDSAIDTNLDVLRNISCDKVSKEVEKRDENIRIEMDKDSSQGKDNLGSVMSLSTEFKSLKVQNVHENLTERNHHIRENTNSIVHLDAKLCVCPVQSLEQTDELSEGKKLYTERICVEQQTEGQWRVEGEKENLPIKNICDEQKENDEENIASSVLPWNSLHTVHPKIYQRDSHDLPMHVTRDSEDIKLKGGDDRNFRKQSSARSSQRLTCPPLHPNDIICMNHETSTICSTPVHSSNEPPDVHTTYSEQEIDRVAKIMLGNIESIWDSSSEDNSYHESVRDSF